jgi:hypothetical protein
MTKQLKTFTFLFLLAISMSGCMTFEGPDHKYVLTQEGFKDVPKNSGSSSSSNEVTTTTSKNTINRHLRAATGNCYTKGRKKDPVPWSSTEYLITADIDVVYPKVMREFGFERWKAPMAYGTDIPICLINTAYEEVVGSHYRMRRYIEHVYQSEEPKNTIEVDLSKESDDKVRVRISYYSGDLVDAQGYETSLKLRFDKALQ